MTRKRRSRPSEGLPPLWTLKQLTCNYSYPYRHITISLQVVENTDKHAVSRFKFEVRKLGSCFPRGAHPYTLHPHPLHCRFSVFIAQEFSLINLYLLLYLSTCTVHYHSLPGPDSSSLSVGVDLNTGSFKC
jgi:hypothetical protein